MFPWEPCKLGGKAQGVIWKAKVVFLHGGRREHWDGQIGVFGLYLFLTLLNNSASNAYHAEIYSTVPHLSTNKRLPKSVFSPPFAVFLGNLSLSLFFLVTKLLKENNKESNIS